MAIAVDAVYENGVLKLKTPVDLPENSQVHIHRARSVTVTTIYPESP